MADLIVFSQCSASEFVFLHRKSTTAIMASQPKCRFLVLEFHQRLMQWSRANQMLYRPLSEWRKLLHRGLYFIKLVVILFCSVSDAWLLCNRSQGVSSETLQVWNRQRCLLDLGQPGMQGLSLITEDQESRRSLSSIISLVSW